MKRIEYKELFQRVEGVARILSGSIPQMAKTLGKEYRTFKGYLSEKRQDNLWPLLPEILAAYPRLSRQWLYFEEGPMLIGQGVPIDQPLQPQAIMRAAEAMAADCHGSWGQVLRMIVDNAREEMEQQSGSPETSKELAEARAEIARLHKKLEGLQSEIIGLQKELLAIHKAEKPQANECPGRAADTGQTVARS